MGVRVIGLFFALLLALPAQAVTVMTTIKPVQLIAKGLVADDDTVEVLLPPGASPHGYALKPSDIRNLKAADLTVWVGPELELFLSKLLQEQPNVLTLTQVEGIPLRHYDGEAETHHHGHDHDHHGIDPHIWLGPESARVAARAITQALITTAPEKADQYRAKLAIFNAQLDETVTDIHAALAQRQQSGYFVFHDAYGYFEQAFGLKKTGHFTVDPSQKPGAKTLVTIRRGLLNHDATCIFTEPQFNPSLVDAVTRNDDVTVIALDPLATAIRVAPDGYQVFLKDMGNRFARCLKHETTH
ncbi:MULTISPECIES: zinc ABC transporter substrate-binding protein ZnuA [Salinivibrio]|uniref:zinc ABC transporter substrate-binding protein ZnuA n=1 Tax=Salinivibrio TaxID=51366 RepID=UPI0009853EA8|nr:MULTISPECIES: zinc ABC transporter substrate-binding protein ZnuA [Salinivibrio]OOF16059.1 zinc ABC transporter substrate-binding protein [Salinivibrio sp. PR919]OOF16794.1 zinc ABC transporter substrate-binding protein [Salinivibrio sp. PR932]OOF20820.1 zinc ABC transporter substrate-binding protein [Salinivibrio sp. IB574]OOF29061.1 zinc ABC transporter substrate-binding protein [Salinivibrio sp. IB872]OOF32335.1 zinc ABC transporter substrate-binding protein [Salinivibrio proteolyticus]